MSEQEKRVGNLSICRRVGDTIRIGDDIIVTVYDREDDKIYIRVTAPLEVPIYRGEVYERMRGNKG